MKSNFSERLKKYRESAGLSERELAHSIGAETASVKSWESAESLPAEEMIEALCKFYGVNRDQLTYVDPDEIIDVNGAETEKIAASAEKSEHRIKTAFRKRDRRFALVMVPVFIAALAAFLILGFTLDAWHPAWLLFLCVPVVYTLIKAVAVGSMRKFNYPLFVATLYLFTGFVLGNWHPSWVIFLTIPVFYIAM